MAGETALFGTLFGLPQNYVQSQVTWDSYEIMWFKNEQFITFYNYPSRNRNPCTVMMDPPRWVYNILQSYFRPWPNVQCYTNNFPSGHLTMLKIGDL